MSNIRIYAPGKAPKEIAAAPGVTLMEAIRSHGFDELLALCGGGMSCGTCHVYVKTAEMFSALPPMGDEERELLESFDSFGPLSRLSCQLECSSMPDEIEFELIQG